MKKVLGILAMLLMVSSVNANLCDDAIDEGLWTSNPELFDLNDDGVTNLSDLALFSMNRSDDVFCNDLLYAHYQSQWTPSSNSRRFQMDLDKEDRIEMSRNLPLFGEVISREIEFNNTRYDVGFSWGGVNLYDKEGEKVTLEGLSITVEYRNFWSRTIVFERE
jgi:hypothetical protein